MEDVLRRQQAFDELITAILARFASCVGSEIGDHIQWSMGETSRFIGADYSFVIQLSLKSGTWSASHQWCAPGIPSHLESHQNIPFGTLPWIERRLLDGEIAAVNSLAAIPSDAAAEREHWELLGFKSVLHVPFRGQGGEIQGCIGLCSHGEPLTWTELDVQQFALLGQVIANALERKRVEKELQDSEARYRATFENAPVGIVNVSVDGKTLEANQRLCDMLGCTREELIGKHYDEFTHPDDRRASANRYDELLAHQTSKGSLQKRYVRKDGRIVWVSVTLSLLDDEAGNPPTIIAAVEDVTDRKQSEEVFDAVPDLIFVLDRQHRIVRANQAAAKRLGCNRENLLGRSCHEVLHGAAEAPEGCLHSQVLADGHDHSRELHEPRLGGALLVSCTPIRDARGEVTGSVHVARDISVLKRTEHELRQAHRQLEQRRALTVAASLDGVWEWEAAGDRVQYSDRFAELLGYSAAEVPPTLDFFRDALHPLDAAALWNAVQNHLDHATPYNVECRLRTKTGDYRWFRTRGQAQRDAAGRATWMAGSLQDIHEQRTAELDLREALEEVERLSERLRAENVYLKEEITSSQGFDEIVGQSEPLRSTLSKIEHVAATDATVLLLGETGTGKELFARAIHAASARNARPLVKVNLAALPSSLIESELFGHVKGAFTGAVFDKIGRFELADGGTLFLDEIGELEPELQTKLLRVLQEGEFEKIGTSQTVQADVRVVAATNRDLHRAIQEGKFRPDLYYRLAVFPIEIPPLRFRRDDIPLLVWHFVSKKQVRLGKSIRTVPKATMDALIEYDWPGNVRELENVVERAMILSPGPTLMVEGSFRTMPRRHAEARSARSGPLDRAEVLRVLEDCGWKIKGTGNAAERLGMKPSTLRYRMRMLGVRRPGFSEEVEL